MHSRRRFVVSMLLVLTMVLGAAMAVHAAELWHYWLTGGEKAGFGRPAGSSQGSVS